MAILAGLVGFIFGTIQVLQHLQYPQEIGPAAVVAIISILYGLLAKLFVGKALADSFQARAFPSQERFNNLDGSADGDALSLA